MRRLFALALALAAPAFGDAPDGGVLQKICNEKPFAETCLAGLLTLRCVCYHQPLHERGTCIDTSRDAARLIDLQPTAKDGKVLAVAFANELVYLMKEPFTKPFLESTNRALDEAMRTRKRFDLWDETVKRLKGDTSKALWYLGVFLQDTSSTTEHLEYLRQRKPPGVDPAAIEALSNLMDLLEPEQLEREKFREWLLLYPPMLPVGMDAELSPSVYHFYTLSYLSLRLKWRNANRKLAAFLPFWIEVSYKFKGIDPDRWPFADPRPFSRTQHEGKLRDIYGAFLATRWAAGLDAAKVKFPEFADRFSADPSGYLRELYFADLSEAKFK